jgi:hypothetical protein
MKEITMKTRHGPQYLVMGIGLGLVLLAALPAGAADTPPAAVADAAGGTMVAPAALAAGEPAPVPATPLAREVADLRARFRAELDRLTAAGATVTDPARAAALQQEMTALKSGLELDLLALQLRHARERGDTEAVAELEPILAAVRGRARADAGPETSAPSDLPATAR